VRTRTTIVTDNSVAAVNSSFGVCENSDPSYGVAAKKIIGGTGQCGGPATAAGRPRARNYVSGSAWNGGGGGVSSTFKLPRFQQGVAGLGSTTNRNLPDVAFPADPATGVLVLLSGCLARADRRNLLVVTNLRRLASRGRPNGKSRQGYANPKIYRIIKASQYKAFHDITAGNNGFPAKAGYDNATGIGSIVGFAFGRRE
jgi:hypothetical protein